jgi:hypothetical protein
MAGLILGQRAKGRGQREGERGKEGNRGEVRGMQKVLQRHVVQIAQITFCGTDP